MLKELLSIVTVPLLRDLGCWEKMARRLGNYSTTISTMLLFRDITPILSVNEKVA
ncbi:MAG: hypothetical protein NTY03_02445 [Candidatus Bathyarchaeota archaeon]|jgi:hypothetical protein|nr:hypothetical protein [Candidatus Bathyarchaeota archaeon]